MARRTIVELVDDLDGGEAEATLAFSVDGKAYELDLSKPNLDAFHAAIEGYVSVARRVSTGSARRVRGGAAASNGSHSGVNVEEIRAWARENGYEVAERGRIARHVMDAYASGTPNTVTTASETPEGESDATTDAPTEAPAKPRRRSRNATAVAATG